LNLLFYYLARAENKTFQLHGRLQNWFLRWWLLALLTTNGLVVPRLSGYKVHTIECIFRSKVALVCANHCRCHFLPIFCQ